MGERSNNLIRLFNLWEGFIDQDDDLPRRLFEPLENRALEGVSLGKEKFAAANHIYYQMAGWHAETGVPTEGKVAEIDLQWAAEAGTVTA